MNPVKANELLNFGLKLGVPKELTLQLRLAFEENRCLATTVRQFQLDGMDNHHARILLVAAFDLSIGDIQILHLWWEGFLMDEDLDLDLREKIAKANSAT
ncbi:hypothetical protein [Blastopirellula retiformator]|uniref:hypothetical protein n=1 Tax=Blastopirellula retiformator TaxID=2527970 RepID=UPI0011B69852|nr:hypothetical protein [Blastopirellula retiformator]